MFRASARRTTRRRLDIAFKICVVVMVGATVVQLVGRLTPPAPKELVWNTMKGSVNAALALADLPDDELETVYRHSWLGEDLAETVNAMVDRETQAGVPTPEEQERLRALSRRLTEFSSRNEG